MGSVLYTHPGELALPRRLDKFVRGATELSHTRVRELLSQGKVQCIRFNSPRNEHDPASLVYDSDEI